MEELKGSRSAVTPVIKPYGGVIMTPQLMSILDPVTERSTALRRTSPELFYAPEEIVRGDDVMFDAMRHAFTLVADGKITDSLMAYREFRRKYRATGHDPESIPKVIETAMFGVLDSVISEVSAGEKIDPERECDHTMVLASIDMGEAHHRELARD